MALYTLVIDLIVNKVKILLVVCQLSRGVISYEDSFISFIYFYLVYTDIDVETQEGVIMWTLLK